MTTLRIANPDKPRRAHAAAYRRMRNWIRLAALVWGLGYLIVTVWNLRMGV